MINNFLSMSNRWTDFKSKQFESWRNRMLVYIHGRFGSVGIILVAEPPGRGTTAPIKFPLLSTSPSGILYPK